MASEIQNIIHESIIGSRAHGLHNEDSDYDYRKIYVAPTEDILSLGFKEKAINTISDKSDSVSYEIGHFLKLATKGNPTVLELLTKDNNFYTTKWSLKLMELLPNLYNPHDAYNAFTGYSHNQHKMFTKGGKRKYKFATAKIRTLYNLIDLFTKGEFRLAIPSDRLELLKDIRNGKLSDDAIMGFSGKLKSDAEKLLPNVKNNQDINKVNALLLEIRQKFWSK